MKRYLITIDGGTTNTRVVLWNQYKESLAVAKTEIGVRDSAREGSNTNLKEAVKFMIQEVISQEGITYEDVASIYACGMLTSNVGIYEVAHLSAPVGIEDYIQGVKEVLIPEICPVPIHFIPGMKNLPGEIGMENLEGMDIMRGEETETIALMELCAKENVLYVLPGSHTKFVSVDGNGKMTGCLTSMAGELLSVLTNQSILTNSVNGQFAPKSYQKEMLLAGGRQAWVTGLSRAAFLTRISSQFVTKDIEACASFLMGAVLAEDILAVKHSSALTVGEQTKVVIAGKEPLRSALRDLFVEEGTFKDVTIFEDKREKFLSGYGMCVIAEKNNGFAN